MSAGVREPFLPLTPFPSNCYFIHMPPSVTVTISCERKNLAKTEEEERFHLF